MKARLLIALLLLLSLHLSASQGWLFTETEYTRIVYREESEEHARALAGFADEVYENLSRFVDHRPEKRVPVVLVDHTALANGYVAPFPAAVYLFLTSPSDAFLTTRTESWLKSVYTHELTHYLHLTNPIGLAKYLRVFGPAALSFITPFMEGWWTEGVATYSESTFAASGGRGDSTAFSHLWKAPLAEKRMWSLAQGRYPSALGPSSRVYATGLLMVDYLMRHWGQESFSAIQKRVSAFPFFGVGPAIKKVSGYRAKDIFTFALAEQGIDTPNEEAMLIHPTQRGNHYIGAVGPFGILGVIATPTRPRGVYRYESEGSPTLLVSLDIADGRAISFAQESALYAHLWVDGRSIEHAALAEESYSDLYLLDLETLKSRRLTQYKRLVNPTISFNGQRALASEVRGPHYDLVEIDLASGAMTTILQDDGVSYLESALDSDGSTIAVVAIEGGNSTLYLGDGAVFQSIVGPTASELHALRFTDEGALLFTAEFELYRYEVDSQQVSRMFSDALGVYDGLVVAKELLYRTYTADGFAIKRVPLSQITPSASQLRLPLDQEIPSSSPPLISQRFSDRLVFNLALPYPFVADGSLQPGVWFHFSSLLRSRSMEGVALWSISEKQPVAQLTYQHLLKRMGLVVSAGYDRGKFNGSVLADLPLYHRMTPRYSQSLRLQGSVNADFSSLSALYSLSVAGRWFMQSSDRRSSDYYGPSSVSVTAISSPFLFTNYKNYQQIFVIGTLLQGQARLGGTSVMGRSSVALSYAPDSDVQAMLPLFSFAPYRATTLKGRITAALLVPLGLFDTPIPYGGIVGGGVELMVQYAFSGDGPSLGWEPLWAVGATLSLHTLLGGTAAPFRPYLQVAHLVGANRWSVTIGIDSQPLIEIISIR
jgi:hypothetical protein